MSHRIELTFVGKAPADELARAKILASDNVTDAIGELSKALLAAGFEHAVECKTVRETGGRPRSKPALVSAAE